MKRGYIGNLSLSGVKMKGENRGNMTSASAHIDRISIADGDQSLISVKGCRWFLRVGATTTFSKGFKSKATASQWISSLGYKLDWRAGYIFRAKGSEYDCEIVDRRGTRAII